MDVSLNLSEVASEHVHDRDLDTLFLADLATHFVDWLHVLSLVQVWNISCIEDVIDVLKHLLVDNLRIDKEETRLSVLSTCLHECLLGILSPVLHSVALNDLNLEQFVVSYEGREP